MKQLTVSLDYGTANFSRRGGPDEAMALPIKALDAEGSVLAEGAASVTMPAQLQLADDTALAFVRLTWPSGRAETQRVDLSQKNQTAITFSDHKIAPNEWSAWAVPKLNPRTPLARPEANIDLGLDRFEKVWLRLWRLEAGVWQQERIAPDATYRNGAAWQLDLTLSASPWMLQIGGSKVTWRFVSLPGGGPARVLITPKDSKDPRADELKVVATSYRADAETLLEFLSRDAMRAVGTLANSTAFARNLLQQKFDDPVSAVAGAYYLLRFDQWDKVPREWFENLSRSFPWLPDASIVHCVRLLREGSATSTSSFNPLDLFAQSLQRGWPVYAEGINLLQEASTLLRSANVRRDDTPFEDAKALGAAKAWAGAAASFYGRSPASPSTQMWVGSVRAPRRKKIATPSSTPVKRGGTFGGAVLGLAETAPARAPTRAGNARRESVGQRAAETAKEVKVLGGPEDDEFLLGSIQR